MIDNNSSYRISRRDFLKLAAVAGLLAGCRSALQPTSTALPQPTVPSEPATALVNGTLIDGTGADPVADAAVVIQGKHIVAAGPRPQVQIPANTQIIDVSGTTILPGFIDAHVHAAFDRDNLRSWAQEGVTTVREMGNGGSRRQLFAFRDEVRGDPQYARLLAVGPYVTVPGGYPIAQWGGNALTVDSPEDARQKVGQLLDDGADAVKIAIESGALFGKSFPMLSPEEATAIVEVVHGRGKLVAAHVTVSSDLEKAIDASVDIITHMVTDRLPEDLIQRVARANIYWMPTLGLWENVSKQYPVSFGANAMDNLGRFVAAGGKVALGTDYGDYIAKFGMPIHEIELMQQAGMTPMQIIVAATKIAAQACNLESEIGTIEAGKIADILVVDGDPAEDIHRLTSVKLVLRDGMVIRQ